MATTSSSCNQQDSCWCFSLYSSCSTISEHVSVFKNMTNPLPFPWVTEFIMALSSSTSCTRRTFSFLISSLYFIPNICFHNHSFIALIFYTYVVTAADLRPVHDSNRLIKFADDTYLIVPGKNSESSAAEIAHIHEWAKKNNLRLNCAKTKELIFRGRQGEAAAVAQAVMTFRRHYKTSSELQV